jgi:hypothetical protein
MGAERLLTYLASIPTALPPTGLIETKTDDSFRKQFFPMIGSSCSDSAEYSWFT